MPSIFQMRGVLYQSVVSHLDSIELFVASLFQLLLLDSPQISQACPSLRIYLHPIVNTTDAKRTIFDILLRGGTQFGFHKRLERVQYFS